MLPMRTDEKIAIENKDEKANKQNTVLPRSILLSLHSRPCNASPQTKITSTILSLLGIEHFVHRSRIIIERIVQLSSDLMQYFRIRFLHIHP